MKRTVAENGSDGDGVMAEDDHHIVANGTDGIVGSADEGPRPAGCRPELELLGATHSAATAGGKQNSDMTRRCGHL